jgi:hypothetical protein
METEDLIDRLCVRAGMIMEDASVVAVTLRRKVSADQRQALDRLEGSSRRISALITAALPLAEQ